MKATFDRMSNDLFWKYYDLRDGFITWRGYDDSYWWNNVAKSFTFCKQLGRSGRVYILNPETDEVTIQEAGWDGAVQPQ